MAAPPAPARRTARPRRRAGRPARRARDQPAAARARAAPAARTSTRAGPRTRAAMQLAARARPSARASAPAHATGSPSTRHAPAGRAPPRPQPQPQPVGARTGAPAGRPAPPASPAPRPPAARPRSAAAATPRRAARRTPGSAAEHQHQRERGGEVRHAAQRHAARHRQRPPVDAVDPPVDLEHAPVGAHDHRSRHHARQAVIVCQMSRTVPAMSFGAITNPPTTVAATMKIARSANRRLSRNTSATSPAIPTIQALRPAAEQSPRFSPTRSPSPAATAGAASSTSQAATHQRPHDQLAASLNPPSGSSIDRRHVPAVPAHQPHPVAQPVHRARSRHRGPAPTPAPTARRRLARASCRDRVDADQLERLAQRRDPHARRHQVLQLVRVARPGTPGRTAPARPRPRVALRARQRLELRRLDATRAAAAPRTTAGRTPPGRRRRRARPAPSDTACHARRAASVTATVTSALPIVDALDAARPTASCTTWREPSRCANCGTIELDQLGRHERRTSAAHERRRPPRRVTPDTRARTPPRTPAPASSGHAAAGTARRPAGRLALRRRQHVARAAQQQQRHHAPQQRAPSSPSNLRRRRAPHAPPEPPTTLACAQPISQPHLPSGCRSQRPPDTAAITHREPTVSPPADGNAAVW